METHQKHLFHGREVVPPIWAVNVTAMKALLARYFESRAVIIRSRDGSPEARLEFAQNKILASLPKKEERLTMRCHEYVELKKQTGTQKGCAH